MSWFERFIRRHLEFKEIGWTHIGEEFTRFRLWRTPWFNIYLHKLNAPHWHPECHDHPWGFVALLLTNGYLEQVGNEKFRRYPGSILFRPATFAHNVITPYGTSWSFIFATRKSREWGFLPCDRHLPSVNWEPYRKMYEGGQ